MRAEASVPGPRADEEGAIRRLRQEAALELSLGNKEGAQGLKEAIRELRAEREQRRQHGKTGAAKG